MNERDARQSAAPVLDAPPRDDAPRPVLPLQPGDRLSRAEFDRRYQAMPGLKKAELLGGVVYMPSPVRLDVHAKPHSLIMWWLGSYRVATPGVQFGDNATVYLGANDEVQPDGLLRLTPADGGMSHINEQGYLVGPPELVVEVAASSASYDLHDKYAVYERSGVREYLVWRVYDQELDWWVWHEGGYRRLVPDGAGVLASSVFPGLWLDVPALLDDQMGRVLATLQRGLDTTGHAAFLGRLASRNEPRGQRKSEKNEA